MDDEIDIEEHDLMDNPTVRSIFPDLSVLKKELLQYEDAPDENPDQVTVVENNSFPRISFESDSSPDKSIIEISIISQSDEPSEQIKYSSYTPKETKSTDKIPFKQIKYSSHTPKETKSTDKIPQRNGQQAHIGPSFIQSIIEKPKAYKRSRTEIKRMVQIKKEKYRCLKNIVFETDNVIKVPKLSKRDKSLSRITNSAEIKIPRNVQTIGKIKKDVNEAGNKINSIKGHKVLASERIKNAPSSINNVTNGRSSNKLYSNKIILGSKPSKIPERKKKEYVNHFLPYEAKVTLQDVSSYLNESKRYCADCLILFPKNSVYDDHKTISHASNIGTDSYVKSKNITNQNNKCALTKKFHSDIANVDATNIVNNSVSQLRHKEPNSLSSNYSCFHCFKLFEDQKSLIEHIYNVLEPKKNVGNMIEKPSKILFDEKRFNEDIMNFQEIHAQKEKSLVIRNTRKKNNYYHKAGKSLQNLYSCPICSQYFKRVRYFTDHMAQKHKVKQMSKLKMVAFDPKCRYCSVKNKTIISYNKHLLRRHRNQNELQRIIKNQPKVIVSKIHNPTSNIKKSENAVSNCQNISGWEPFAMISVLFKCNKCDIHFLTAKDAVIHVEHMEMLVNWKCLICKRIFKDRDVAFHRKQHTFSDNFEVYNLGESALNRVLYNCSKCAIHFSEDRYVCHYPTCELETADSAYCDLCDILVDKSSMSFHKYCHKYNKFKSTDFTIIETKIILEKDLCIVHQNENSAPKIHEEVDTENNMRVDKSSSSETISREAKLSKKVDKVSVVKSSSCKTISKKVQFDMKKKKKFVDKSCLIKLKSKNPEFNNSLILSYCHTCKCFLSNIGSSRKVHIQSRCAHIIKYICKYCGIMTTDNGTQSHRQLHRKQKQLKLQDFKIYDLKSKKQICPPIPEFPNCEICGIHFLSKVAKKGHECSEDDYLTCQICHTKLSEAAFKLHMLFHNYCIKDEIHSTPNVFAPKTDEIHKKLTYTSSSAASEKIIEPNEMFPIIYSCRACFTAFDTYDKVIEHCQDHSARRHGLSPSLKCNTCSMNFDRSSYETHKKLHENTNSDERSFKILCFDPIYFSSENKIWTKHVLGALPTEQSDMILNNSIYKFEGRLQMEVIQDGASNLTVYKCDKCRSFIDPILVYKHAENSCFKQRKHPCSHCGLPFISTATRVDHEKVHRVPNIRLKSYRIVIFNREGDAAFNNLIFVNQYRYVLYQCRNCNGVVSKSTYEKHQCDKESIRKCLQCGLLLYKDDFKYHMTKHKDLVKFNKERIKVILLGDRKDAKNDVNFDLQSTFTGTICDFTFYKCSNCGICLTSEDQKLKHRCCNSTSNAECPSCGLIFLKEKLKYHIKLHGNDLDFIKDNMNIITFDGNTTPMEYKGVSNEIMTKKIEQDAPIDNTKTILHDDTGRENIVDNSFTKDDKDIIKNVANIYKCHCGLHFVDEQCAKAHLGICNPRIRASKQNCSKCDLLFTPSDLFDHLLMHHGDKKIAYKFNIIDVVKESTQILYKCPKCCLHFYTANEAYKHFEQCDEKGNDGKECTKCSLKLHSSSFNENNHVGCKGDFRVEVISEKPIFISYDNNLTDRTKNVSHF